MFFLIKESTSSMQTDKVCNNLERNLLNLFLWSCWGLLQFFSQSEAGQCMTLSFGRRLHFGRQWLAVANWTAEKFHCSQFETKCWVKYDFLPNAPRKIPALSAKGSVITFRLAQGNGANTIPRPVLGVVQSNKCSKLKARLSFWHRYSS